MYEETNHFVCQNPTDVVALKLDKPVYTTNLVVTKFSILKGALEEYIHKEYLDVPGILVKQEDVSTVCCFLFQ